MIPDKELAEIKRRASSIVTPWAKTVLRLIAEIERLKKSRKND